MTLDAHRLSFGAAAADYDQARPTYPVAALSWTFAPVGTGRLRVVDLGAGTGLLSRVVAAAGHEVILDRRDADEVERHPCPRCQAGARLAVPVAIRRGRRELSHRPVHQSGPAEQRRYGY